MSSRDLGLDDFLNDKSGGGIDAKFLSKWNKRNPPQVDVAFHRGSPVATKVYRHGLQRLVPLQDRTTRKTVVKVWSDNAVCRETEDVLKKQNKRDDDGGRLVPPVKCGICKTIEYVRSLVARGDLSWTDPVFRFKGDEDTVVIHAGGLYNAFSRDDLTDAERTEIGDANIKVREAWKENWMAKMNYIFRVAEFGKPDLGIQIAIETMLLGDKVKKVIRDKMEAEGDDEGNPIKNPYVVRWKYLPDEKVFSNKYDANAMPKLKLDAAMMELITNAPSPDITPLTEAHNPASARATLETHCLVDLPWDQLFDAKAAPPEVRPRPTQAQVPGKAKEPEPEAEFGCDECGAAMKASDTKCKGCGHEYEVEKEEEPPPPPKKELPKRSSAAKAAPAADPPPKPAAKAPAKAKPAPAEEPAAEDQDDLPF